MRDFWEVHADSEQQLKSWFQETSNAEWKNPNEVKKEYPSASILNDNRIVFNIKGNNYRLIVRINYIKYCIDRKIENLILVITVNHKVYHAARRYLRHF